MLLVAGAVVVAVGAGTEPGERRLDAARIAIAGWSAESITAFSVGYRYESIGDNTSNPGPSHRAALVVALDGIDVTASDLGDRGSAVSSCSAPASAPVTRSPARFGSCWPGPTCSASLTRST
jgi:hypothetical protein